MRLLIDKAESNAGQGKNRSYWDAASEEYQRDHGADLLERAYAWGVWRIPEQELGVLEDPADKDILELGCGAAQWSIALAQRAANVIGLDISAQQLSHARKNMDSTGARFPLVQALAERTPFEAGSFDVVFCDHGGMSFADPLLTIPECARILRSGGLLAFCMTSPILDLCWEDESGQAECRPTANLNPGYFDLHRQEDRYHVKYQLPYGEWIRLFRRNGFVVEDLIELRPQPGARTTYNTYVSYDWAREWPADHIWKVRKAS